MALATETAPLPPPATPAGATPAGATPTGATPTGASSRNPAQNEVLALLGSRAAERPTFAPGLRHELRDDLEDGLRPLLDALPEGEVLRLSKYPLAQVHACEHRFLADRERPFAWSPASARGTVAHKAVELAIHWPDDPRPLDLVDEAVRRLAQQGGSLASYLADASVVDRAELRAEANDRVAKFLECFPPLRSSWRPVTESAVRIDLFDGRIVLQGRVDLTLGHARGSTARKVLIDLKTGGFSPTHAHDLRFYALLETLRIGTPPIRLATYYLDSGRPHAEAVTTDVLHTAVRRTVDGAARLVELCHHDHPPVLRPGPACRWCPLRSGCPEAVEGTGTDVEAMG